MSDSSLSLPSFPSLSPSIFCSSKVSSVPLLSVSQRRLGKSLAGRKKLFMLKKKARACWSRLLWRSTPEARMMRRPAPVPVAPAHTHPAGIAEGAPPCKRAVFMSSWLLETNCSSSRISSRRILLMPWDRRHAVELQPRGRFPT